MSDAFLPGSGFDTYESQVKVLVQMDGSRECAVAVRILQQQGFAVAGAAVRLAAEQTAQAESAKKAAEALGIECIVLNAEALAEQDAAVLGEGGTPLFAALLTALAMAVCSGVFSWFIGMSSRYALVYGSLASLIILLVWLYLCGNILLLGAAVSRTWVIRRTR